MKFRAGQRVKRAITGEGLSDPLLINLSLGVEGTVKRYDSFDSHGRFVLVDWDRQGEITVYEWTLVPLTDPKAEQFLQSIRDIVKDPMKPLPMEVEELARVRGGA